MFFLFIEIYLLELRIYMIIMKNFNTEKLKIAYFLKILKDTINHLVEFCPVNFEIGKQTYTKYNHIIIT